MSLTNINLPGFVIADLYRNSLIQPSAAEGLPKALPEEGALPKQQKAHTPPLLEGDGGRPAEPVAPPAVEQQPVVKEPVVEPVTTARPVAKEEPVVYKTLGNNKQQITVVVNCPKDVYVPEADLQFLTKMLGACKLNMADVAIVNYASAPIAIDRLKTQLQPKYLLLFGVEPGDIQLPISFPPFKEQPYAGTTYLFTPALSQLNQETEEAKLLKRKLWDCLKRMFL